MKSKYSSKRSKNMMYHSQIDKIKSSKRKSLETAIGNKTYMKKKIKHIRNTRDPQ